MREIKDFFQTTAKRLQQRGSALLTSLMVMVGLSLLGLAFVAISETESAISINERNHSQTVSVAESGARLVVQWFQFPARMETLQLMPTNINAFKIERTSGTYTGYYKETQPRLCDLPYGPANEDLFFGAEETADIQITRNTAAGVTWLDALNNQVLGPEGATQAREGGEITEIRVYAPPLVGGDLQPPLPTAAPRFWNGGTRYGVATIMVRAEKFNQSLAAAGTRRSIGRAECRIVVSQFPLPQPGGPLQSSTTLATNGNFNVNWGLVSAQQTLNLQKDYETIPFFNAYERVHINRGYDSSVQWAPVTPYIVGDIVRPTPAAITARPQLAVHEYEVTMAGTSGALPANEPVWTTAANSVVPGGPPNFRERAPTAWPLTFGGAAGPSNRPWLYWIARGDKNIEDPWFHARSAQNITGSATGQPQPDPFIFNNPNSALGGSPPAQATHHFQFQSFDSYSQFKNLIFPIINYDFWKAAAIASNGQQGVHYLQRAPAAGADQYTNGVNTKGFEAWVTSQPGYFFFETDNNQNPQNGGPGVLAPEVQANGGTALWTGFIYLNANYKTTGLAGVAGNFNQPGEPYMDIGYRQVALVTGGGSTIGDFIRDASGAPVVTGAVNEIWDFQDLPWGNTGNVTGFGAGNDEFDVFIAQRTVTDPSPPFASYPGFFPVPFKPGCKPGKNTCVTCDCSEPHEPYLNLQYNTNPLNIVVGWQSPGAQSRVAKRTTGQGRRTDPPVACNAASPLRDCTSNSYDLDGGLVTFGNPPTTDGVLFVEGSFTSTGNAVYYGSVLVGQGGVNVKGTPQLWYDEQLSRGTWRPPGLPRVLVTSVETDR